jgi:cardiolipin synthase
VGILAYVLLGETNIGKRRVARAQRVLDALPPLAAASPEDAARAAVTPPERCTALFRLGESISGFPVVGGNSAELLADADAAVVRMVKDIDAAREHVHLVFYIWLADGNGLAVAQALRRAAARGVTCRAMADHLGSRAMIASEHWRAMGEAGVKLGVALPIGHLALRVFDGRIDLRNHRKLVVIDDAITYCGSQNCADPAFLVKAKYAPWVDVWARFQGPIARQNQHVFAGDWMTYVDEDLTGLLEAPVRAPRAGIAAQVIATGPTLRASAMPETFATLMHAARRRLVITTPYYVPNESIQEALCAAAYRGVETTFVVPARNDSWIVAAASRTYYRDLLVAGVRIHEFVGGLLHAKTMTVDEDLTLIGSANMDRRSFDLNYENNVLVWDAAFTAQVRARQASYVASARPVTLEDLEAWPLARRLRDNTVAMLGPVL